MDAVRVLTWLRPRPLSVSGLLQVAQREGFTPSEQEMEATINLQLSQKHIDQVGEYYRVTNAGIAFLEECSVEVQ